MKDPIHNITIHDHCTIEFLAGMCHALSDERGEVFVKIDSVNGRPRAMFQRDEVDMSIPVYLRKKSVEQI